MTKRIEIKTLDGYWLYLVGIVVFGLFSFNGLPFLIALFQWFSGDLSIDAGKGAIIVSVLLPTIIPFGAMLACIIAFIKGRKRAQEYERIMDTTEGVTIDLQYIVETVRGKKRSVSYGFYFTKDDQLFHIGSCYSDGFPIHDPVFHDVVQNQPFTVHKIGGQYYTTSKRLMALKSALMDAYNAAKIEQGKKCE